VKLSANVITNGRYYKAGTDISDDLLSDAMRRYAVSDVQQQRRDSDDIEAKVRKSKPRRNRTASYVKRGESFELASKVELIAGEPLYWHRKKAFGVTEKLIAFSRVGSEA
jgi:hypothetical protein